MRLDEITGFGERFQIGTQVESSVAEPVIDTADADTEAAVNFEDEQRLALQEETSEQVEDLFRKQPSKRFLISCARRVLRAYRDIRNGHRLHNGTSSLDFIIDCEKLIGTLSPRQQALLLLIEHGRATPRELEKLYPGELDEAYLTLGTLFQERGIARTYLCKFED